MAEAALFSIASKLLFTVASSAFQKAYEKGSSIWEARDELDKLARSVQTIQAVLRDAEKKKEGSAAVRDWIERVSDVLYDAEDLFDEVATDEMLKQQIKGDKPLKKVQAYCFKLNPIVSRNSIANKVKDIRKRLLEISNDMAQLEFMKSVYEQPISGVRKETGSFVDSEEVFGREEDKETILKMLLDDQSNNGGQDFSIIAVVGIAGMGKTTLAQLVYNDDEVLKNFKKRWFACISDTNDDKEIIGKIFQSVCKKNYGNFDLSHLQTEIRKSVQMKKFLLVLDDVRDEDCASWRHRMSLLRGGAKGSKIIVTTRSLSVAKAVSALETHLLPGLLESGSWDLFKRIAFSTPEKEKDPKWGNLGREIVKKCTNVPLVISSVANILRTKDTIQEWEFFKDNKLPKVDQLSGDSIMQTLKLKYDDLPFNLKPCFAYCSLFPKDHIFDMDQLIYLWIAQGYIEPNHEKQTDELVGYSYFMELHRRSFFEKGKNCDGIFNKEYKMHDSVYDLAQFVAREEIMVLTKPPTQLNKRARHVSFGPGVDTSHMLDTNRLRSLLFVPHQFRSDEERQFTYGKYLRALSMSKLGIKIVSSSICELKHLRYLDLSYNQFESLPDSLTNLLNLLTLDLQCCYSLKALPDSFRKLINLRKLDIDGCGELKHMPPGMGELTCLQSLSNFKVGKAIEGVQMSRLDVLDGFQLRGKLEIEFEEGIDNWDGDECWKLPVSLEVVFIFQYPGRRIPHWSNHPSLLPNLSRLDLYNYLKVKYLPPLRCLPNLKELYLSDLKELEYIEEEGEEDNGCTTVAAGYINNSASFFPVLERLELLDLPKLKGWSRRKVEAATSSSSESASPDLFLSFPLLSRLAISDCEELSSFPLSPCVRRLEIRNMGVGLMQQLLSAASINPSSLEELSIYECQGLEYFLAAEAFSSLKICHIVDCHSLESVEVEALPSLVNLDIRGCKQLKSLRIARLNALREFTLRGCPQEFELWGIQQDKGCSVDWDSLPNLCQLYVDRRPSPEELPYCLGHLQGEEGLYQLSILA